MPAEEKRDGALHNLALASFTPVGKPGQPNGARTNPSKLRFYKPRLQSAVEKFDAFAALRHNKSMWLRNARLTGAMLWAILARSDRTTATHMNNIICLSAAMERRPPTHHLLCGYRTTDSPKKTNVQSSSATWNSRCP